MALLGSLLHFRRGECSLMLVAALVALLMMPGASHAAIEPQNAQAVWLWLQSETAAPIGPNSLAKPSQLLAQSHQTPDLSPQNVAETLLSTATSHCGQHLTRCASENTTRTENSTAAPPIERHAVAYLSGVRTNRRLN